MAHGTHDFDDDPRNDRILVWVNGELLPRERAVVSVFDSGFVLGDGVWAGLRVRAGHPAFLERHLDRLEQGARAIMLDIGLSREELTRAIYETLRANDMTDGVHVRLMVTRGIKRTPYQDPRVTIGPATVVIIAEHKAPLPATVENGITLQAVYEEAGVGPLDVDVIELHDFFSCKELLTYEALGLCAEGDGGRLIDDGDTTYGGRWVVNPSGGLISKSHPLGATGLAQCAELTWQLRGEAGDRQVAEADLCLQHNVGLGGAAVVTLYARAA